MTTYTATYSPQDNKLRLAASTRLDRETYQRLLLGTQTGDFRRPHVDAGAGRQSNVKLMAKLSDGTVVDLPCSKVAA